MQAQQITHLVNRDLRYFIAFGFGSGLMPFAPGTFGTLAAIPIYLLLCYTSWPFYLLFVFISFWVGVQLCQEISIELQQSDFSGIVWDECVGFWITMFMIPLNWKWLLLGFILFRFFDIVKPPPIRQLEQKFQNGFGIMIDDVVAGLMAWLTLIFIVWITK